MAINASHVTAPATVSLLKAAQRCVDFLRSSRRFHPPVFPLPQFWEPPQLRQLPRNSS
jgi:hypothetical protein